MIATICQTPTEASRAAATRIYRLLKTELERSSRASLVASGGNTPKQCYSFLADSPLQWDKVDIVPSDERNVPEGHELRNSTMIDQHLCQYRAQSAALRSMDEFPAIARPTTVTLLGVGEDGHFASIFPDMPNLAQALDLECDADLLHVNTEASPVSRTTLTLQALCNSQYIVLLAFGLTKQRVLKSPAGLPVQHLLQQSQVPIELFWSP